MQVQRGSKPCVWRNTTGMGGLAGLAKEVPFTVRRNMRSLALGAGTNAEAGSKKGDVFLFSHEGEFVSIVRVFFLQR